MMAGHSAIAQVDYALASDEDNRRASFAQVTNWELFAPDGHPVKGGVYDIRMGTIDHGVTCVTCSHGKKQCPGHRGSIELRAGVFQPLAIAEVRRWLKVVCLRCGALVVEREKFAGVRAGRRLNRAAAAAAEGHPCPRCGERHPRIAKDDDDHFTFKAEPPAERKARRGEKPRGAKLYPDQVRAAFERVADADVLALGRPLTSHPRHLVLRVLEVPPNTVRPSVRHFGGTGSSYHDSTNLIQHIVRKNAALPERLPDALGPRRAAGAEAVPDELGRSLANLEQLVYDLIKGSQSTSAVQGNSGRRGLVVGPRPMHSFLKGLSQKGGRIRANLLGGRVFYISRSTISGNTRFRLDEVGVPLEFARTLQVEETVQEANRDRLYPFFLNGRRRYPGSTLLLRRATGELHDVALLRDQWLENGDVLWRDVVTGDRVLFGRQPTLEISSIGSHRAVVLRDPTVNTLQFNVLACEYYNADYDGDQMNCSVPHGPGPRAEVPVVSDVSNAFISVKTGGPVNGQVQDSVVGCAELTRGGVRLDRYHAMALFATAGLEDPPDFGEAASFSGREAVSLALAAAPVSYSRRPTSFNEVFAPYLPYPADEALTVVERGRLVRGVLDARAVGARAAGGLFHLVEREHGPKRALDMIFAVQQVALQFVAFRGFTVGAADLLPGPAARARIDELCARVLLEAELVTGRLLRGELVPPIGETVRRHYERLQVNALGLPEAELLRWILADVRPDSNGLLRMLLTGAKGKNPNLLNISGKVGQTLINGESSPSAAPRPTSPASTPGPRATASSPTATWRG
jgi:DNA-directed RNA polymerase II subunit RPB1